MDNKWENKCLQEDNNNKTFQWVMVQDQQCSNNKKVVMNPNCQ